MSNNQNLTTAMTKSTIDFRASSKWVKVHKEELDIDNLGSSYPDDTRSSVLLAHAVSLVHHCTLNSKQSFQMAISPTFLTLALAFSDACVLDCPRHWVESYFRVGIDSRIDNPGFLFVGYWDY
jgi:hypothetical protein